MSLSMLSFTSLLKGTQEGWGWEEEEEEEETSYLLCLSPSWHSVRIVILFLIMNLDLMNVHVWKAQKGWICSLIGWQKRFLTRLASWPHHQAWGNRNAGIHEWSITWQLTERQVIWNINTRWQRGEERESSFCCCEIMWILKMSILMIE